MPARSAVQRAEPPCHLKPYQIPSHLRLEPRDAHAVHTSPTHVGKGNNACNRCRLFLQTRVPLLTLGNPFLSKIIRSALIFTTSSVAPFIDMLSRRTVTVHCVLICIAASLQFVSGYVAQLPNTIVEPAPNSNSATPNNPLSTPFHA